jgi:prolyl 4-hydroxylase
VYNFTKVGFQKIRVPEKLWKLINDFYLANKDKEQNEWKETINSYHNMWQAPPYFISLEDEALGGGKFLQREIWDEVRPILEEWTGQRLSPVSMYGIRVYKNNSILAPHVDRMPLVTSCIINVDQDVDEDWPLEVFDHEGNALNVTMAPGDMVSDWI